MGGAELDFKEMCARHGVTPRTLRYYEYLELITPRREGRARWYGPRAQARMTLILRGRRFGFSLEEIRRWLALYDSRGSQAQMRAWVELADAKLAELQAQQAGLANTIVELRELRAEAARMAAEGSGPPRPDRESPPPEP